MKLLFFAILTAIFFVSTTTFASAQQSGIFEAKFVSSFGSLGSGDGKFAVPQGITLDQSGNIYVVDQDNNRVEKFDSSGNFISKIGTYGSGDGQFNAPTMVAADKSGNIYVTDISNHRVEKFDSAGNFVLKFGTYGNSTGQFRNIQGISVDSTGNVYVVDLLNLVQEFDSNGKYITKIGTQGSGPGQLDHPVDVAFDSTGNLYVTDSGNSRVVEFSSNNIFLKQWGSYCPLYNKIDGPKYCVDPDGSGPLAIGDGQFDDPNGIAIDNSGNVYVSDMNNNRVEIFDSSGHFVSKFGSGGGSDSGQFADPNGIAVDNLGNVYVVDMNNERVQIFHVDYNGTVISNNDTTQSPTTTTTPSFSIGFGSSFGSFGTDAGHFHNPQGIASDTSGNVYVVDQVNNRVEKFDSHGNFMSVIGSGGSADGQLSSPTGVAVDKSGNIYVTDIGHNRVEKFDSSGNFVLQFGTSGKNDGQFSSLQGIAVDDSGSVYVTDLLHPVQKFDSSGNFVSEIGKGQIDSAQGVTVDKSGNVYVLDSSGEYVQIVEFSNTGEFIKRWGTFCNIFTTQGCIDLDGSGPFALGDGQFKDPNGIAVDDSGNVYVTDTGNSRVEVFDPSGHFIYKFGTNGNGDNQFSDAMGITVNNSGSLYVVDQNNNRVETFNITYGNISSAPNDVLTTPSTLPVPVIQTPPPVPAWFVSAFGSPGSNTGQFSFPQGIALDGLGNVYVVNQGNNRIEKFDSHGNFMSVIGSGGSADGQLSAPTGIAVDKDGNIYVTDIANYRVEKFNPSGTFALKFGTRGDKDGQFNSLQGIAVDNSGNIYVTDTTNSIQKFDHAGNFISKIGKGQFNGANGVAVDKSDNIYVLDSGNSQVVKFANNGTMITKWGSYCDMSNGRDCIDTDGSGPLAIGDGQFKDPNGIAVDDSGRVYVTDYNHRVEIFDSSGNFLYKFGSPGSYSGQFAQPNGIAISASGDIYVVDQGNARVQILNIDNLHIPGWSNGLATQSQTAEQSTTSSNSSATTTTINPPTQVPSLSSMSKIPSWAKSIFYFYGQGQISDSDLINAINFLIQQNVIQLKS